MNTLNLLIGAGLLSVSFNVPASIAIDYGDTDPVVGSERGLNLVEIFRYDLDDDIENIDDHLIAYDFGEVIPDYFRIGGDVDNEHDDGDLYVLFENVDNRSWGVFDTSSWDSHETFDMYDSLFSGYSEDDDEDEDEEHEYKSEEHHEYHFEPEHIVGYSAVPIPASIWLFGTGLIGLVGVARRK